MEGGGYFKTENGDGRGNFEKKELRNKAIANVNSSYLHHLTYKQDLYIHRQKFSSVTMVGFIDDIGETTTKVEFKLRDGEGLPIMVQKWKSNPESGLSMDNGVLMKEGMLVRVYGSARRTANIPEPHIIAFKVLPVTDFNELVMHNIETIASNLILNKRKNNILAGLPPYTGFPGSTEPSSSQPQGGDIQSAKSVAEELPPINPGMKPADNMVLKAIQNCQDTNGLSKDELIKSLRSLNKAAIETALDFLMTEGHVYTTCDDVHFKSTDA